MILPMVPPNVALSNLFEDLAKIVGLSKSDPESSTFKILDTVQLSAPELCSVADGVLAFDALDGYHSQSEFKDTDPAIFNRL